MMYIMRLYFIDFIAQQLEKRKNNAKSVRNCDKKAQCDILGKFPILQVIT